MIRAQLVDGQREAWCAGNLTQLAGVVVFALWLAIFFGSAVVQLEMFLFSGRIPFKPVVFKVLLILALLFLLFVRRGISFPEKGRVLWLVLAGYFALWMVVQAVTTNYKALDLVFSIYSLYFYFLVIPLVYVLRGHVNANVVERSFVFLGAAAVVVGLLQSILNDPIFPVESVSGWFKVNSWNFFGTVREFSFFSAPNSFGGALVFLIPYSISAFIFSGGVKRIFMVVLMLGALTATYLTYTRAVYLWVLLSLVTLAVLLLRQLSCARKLLVPGYAIFGVLVALGADIVNSLASGNKLLSSSSMNQRYVEWHKYGQVWFHDVVSFLFGTGFVQGAHFSILSGVVIDNEYLAIGLQGGVVALTVTMIFMIWMTYYLFKVAQYNPSPITLGVACAFSVWPAAAVFGLLPQSFFMLFMLGVFLDKRCHGGG